MGNKSILAGLAFVLLVLVGAFWASREENVGELNQSTEDQETGVMVNRVIDGDTIEVKTEDGEYERVRLIGIDAPEIDWEFLSEKEDVVDDSECFAWESRQYLSDNIDGEKVELVFDESQGRRDAHGRLLAYILDEGENLNLEMVKDGYARELTVGRAYQYRSEFVAAESDARDMNREMWGVCNL